MPSIFKNQHLTKKNGPRLRTVLIASRCVQTIFSQRIHLARVARDDEWGVLLAGEFVPGPYKKRLKEEGFNFFSVPVNQRSLSMVSLIRAVGAFYLLCRRVRPDVFHAFTIKPTVTGLAGAWLAGVPIRLATVAGLGHIFLTSSAVVRFFGVLLLRSSLLFAHKVYFYNESDRDFFLQKKIVSSDKTALVNGSGLDVSQYENTPVPKADSFILLFIGRILAEKGILDLLEAVKLLKPECRVVLHVVGDLDPNNPSSLDKYEFETKLAAIGGKWHGYSNEVAHHISIAHAVVLPSYREGIPLALLEAGASGRPMIATDVPGCREVVKHGVSGLLVPSGDVGALASAIDQLASDRILTARMGVEARNDVAARFDTKIVNRAVVGDYVTMLDAIRR